MMKPNTALIDAASSEAPKERRYEPIARGVVITCRNSPHDIEAVWSPRAGSGSSTMAEGRSAGAGASCRGSRAAIHKEEGRTRLCAKQGLKARRKPGDLRDPQYQDLVGHFGEAARQSFGDVAEVQLGAHLKPVHRLRLRTRIKQRTHAMRALPVGRAGRQNADVNALGRDVTQQACCDGKG